MNRRSFFGFIAAAPLLPIVAKAEPVDDGWYPMLSYTPLYTGFAGGGPGGYPMTLVCENHHDKAWPDECDCGPGMRLNCVDPFAHQLS